MSKKGINFPLEGRLDTQNLDMDQTDYNNLFDEDPEFILKHEKTQSIEQFKFLSPICPDEKCNLCIDICPEDMLNELDMVAKEKGMIEHSDENEWLKIMTATRKNREAAVMEVSVKSPSSNINKLLKQKEEEDKSKSHLKVVVQNNQVAGFIDNDETSIKHMGMHKFGIVKEAHNF